jgi:predicted alpha/beta hydrolase family esterase
LLVVPGLRGSGPDHWQSWIEHLHPGAVRVQQADWNAPSLDAWAAQIGRTVAAWPEARWLAVGHSCGCLALARWLAEGRQRQVHGALMVAPASPARFGLHPGQIERRLPVDTTVVTSRNDPWFAESGAQQLASRWGAQAFDAGAAGHINPESGHGPWPVGADLVDEALWRLRKGPGSTAARQAPALSFAV